MTWNPFGNKRIYLDHAAATPLSHAVANAMRTLEAQLYVNPSGIHKEAVRARAVLEQARQDIADVVVTTRAGIIFTSGGTESNNLALMGVIEKLAETGRRYDDMEILTAPIEHPSILFPLRALEKKGVSLAFIPVDREGRVVEEKFAELISPKTVLVTCAYANSEIGTVQDLKALSRIVRKKRKEYGSEYPYIHSDASQAPLWLPCKMDSLGLDLMTLDAGKCHGPKSAGILAIRGDILLSPIFRGGSQERGMRPGTENVALAVGSALSLKEAQKGWEARASRVAALRDNFIQELSAVFPTLVVNGSREFRLANNANVSIPGIDGEYAVVGLDERGVACSTRSACKVGEEGGSHVLRALGLHEDIVLGALRFSLGEETSSAELRAVIERLKEHVAIANSVTRKET